MRTNLRRLGVKNSWEVVTTVRVGSRPYRKKELPDGNHGRCGAGTAKHPGAGDGRAGPYPWRHPAAEEVLRFLARADAGLGVASEGQRRHCRFSDDGCST